MLQELSPEQQNILYVIMTGVKSKETARMDLDNRLCNPILSFKSWSFFDNIYNKRKEVDCMTGLRYQGSNQIFLRLGEEFHSRQSLQLVVQKMPELREEALRLVQREDEIRAFYDKMASLLRHQ